MPCRFLPPILTPFALLAFVCLALPAAADPAAPLPRLSNLRSDILYTHRGEFVQVKPMRALTLNAHVSQFAYDPLGLEIAIVGSETSGDQTTDFVKTFDAHTGKEISRYAVTAPTDAQSTGLGLLGFSTSGRYLLLQQFTPEPNDPSTAQTEFLRWDLSADPPTMHVINPQSALPPEQQSADLAGSADANLSPDRRWLAFNQSVHALKDDGNPGPDQNTHLLYDPERDTFRVLTLPPHASSFFWSDNTHLQIWQDGKRKQFDVVTGQIIPLTTPLDSAPSSVSKQYPDFLLDTEPQTLWDKRQHSGSLDACVLWIHRTPYGQVPLGVAAAGLMPNYQEDGQNHDPQAVWSPTGKQIAFVASGDLCVTDLVSATEALPHEKMAVGLKLSCAEEQELAVSNLKQIGLALIQNIQDNDEKYPDANGLVKTLAPYAKTTDIFQTDGHAFVYERPGVSLANVESPATTENGYIDLPCARIVLFCDGHVKVFAK